MINPYLKLEAALNQLLDQDKDKLEPRPYRDWKIMLFCFGLAVVLLVGGGWWLNWQFSHNGSFFSPVANRIESEAIDLVQLKAAAVEIDRRAREFDRLFQSAASAVDPAR